MVKKDSKNYSEIVKKGSFYLAIFNRIKEGKSPTFISKEYGIPKQNLYYYTKRLLKEKLIGKTGKGRHSKWFVLVKDFSLGTRPTTNLHALQISIPISSGNIGVQGWEIKEELKNWTPTYKKLEVLGGLTIKNNNNKSLSLFPHTRDLQDLKEIDDLCLNLRNWAREYFRREFQVELDISKAEVKSLHIATQDTISEEMLGKGERFELDLDKKAEKVFQPDKIKAKAWLDGSPFQFTAETNDKAWKRAYLSMPFNIVNLASSLPALEEYNKNLKLHIEVQQEQLKTLKKIQENLHR